MNNAQKNWIWFLAILALIVGGGIYLGQSRRAELGESFSYSMDEYKKVDPALIKYKEVESIFPTLGNPSALAFGLDGRLIEVEGATCLAVDEDGMVYAGMHDHVVANSKPWKSPSDQAYLTSIAVDDDFVFVADAGSRCIWRYPKEGGEPLKIESERKFYIPSPFFDLDIGTDGSLWVVNPGYHAFENLRRDGTLISSWERSSFHIEGFSGCCNPAHFALMPDGAFLTAEKGLVRVKIHNLDGSLRCVVATPDQFDGAIKDIAVDDSGRIYVLTDDRVRVFEEKKP